MLIMMTPASSEHCRDMTMKVAGDVNHMQTNEPHLTNIICI